MAWYQKSKILIWLVFILLGINISVLGFSVLKSQPANGPGQPGQKDHDPMNFLIRELAFTDEQAVVYRKMAEAHRASMDSILKEKRQTKDAFFGMIASDQPDSAWRPLLEQIGQLEMARDEMTMSHFRKVLALCDPAQSQKFEQVMMEILHHPPGPPHGRGKPHHPPGHPPRR